LPARRSVMRPRGVGLSSATRTVPVRQSCGTAVGRSRERAAPAAVRWIEPADAGRRRHHRNVHRLGPVRPTKGNVPEPDVFDRFSAAVPAMPDPPPGRARANRWLRAVHWWCRRSSATRKGRFAVGAARQQRPGLARDDSPVRFARRTCRETCLGRQQSGMSQGDHQAAGGVGVEPMRQPWPILAAGQQRKPVLDAAPSRWPGVNGQPGRLVEHDEARVAKKFDRTGW
jgi:hypothetical protein